MRKIILSLFILIFLLGCVTEVEKPVQLDLATEVGNTTKYECDTDEPRRFVLFGDQGISNNSINLLKQTTCSDVIIHLGDFDYIDNVTAFKALYTYTGASLVAVVGNHDVLKWPEYREYLTSLDVPGNCSGDYGINYACEFDDVFVVLSGIGTYGENHLEFLEAELSNSNATWKICAWHKNQKLMQVGGKKDDVGWDAYDICRAHGAIIATGHEHSYSRTFVMNNFTNQSVSSFNETMNLEPGQTFAFVSGLGGKSVRAPKDSLEKNPWWAKTYTANDGAIAGALFCIFDDVGSCEFITEEGVVIDSFGVTQSK
jgi:predicted phosphodiesterase